MKSRDGWVWLALQGHLLAQLLRALFRGQPVHRQVSVELPGAPGTWREWWPRWVYYCDRCDAEALKRLGLKFEVWGGPC